VAFLGFSHFFKIIAVNMPWPWGFKPVRFSTIVLQPTVG